MTDSEASHSEEDDDGFDDQYSNDDDEETKALEELGDGIYLKSGDLLQLREFNANGMGSILTNGGGFATLQSENSATIIIEKIFASSQNKNSTSGISSFLIRNGDTVRLKLVDDRVHSSSYLTVYKGWWLKWVQHPTSHTCLFTIRTKDVEKDLGSHTFSDSLGIAVQSSYLRLGGTFSLRSKISALEVGVRVNNSARFGGRVLGLYKPGSCYVTECSNETQEISNNSGTNYAIKQMLTPLNLCAYMTCASDQNFANNCSNVHATAETLSPVSGKFRVEEFTIDTPAWLEVMHRSKRQIFRVYAIRLSKKNRPSITNDDDKIKLLRLRTGKELTPILQYGASCGLYRDDR
jgi:hypothetical protein